MGITGGRCIAYGTIGAALAFASMAMGQSSSEPEPPMPVSKTGLPMEASWDAAPEAPGGKLSRTGPYRTSRWGNIVVRGRLEGDRVVSALTFIQCGRARNPAMQVALIGVAPDDLCDDVVALESGRTRLVHDRNYKLYGQSTGWTVIDFVQEVGNTAFHDGFSTPTEKHERKLGVSSLGAAFQVQDGKFVFFAPGETVELTENVIFKVTPVMEEGEISNIQIAAAMDGYGTGAKPKRPIGFYILFFGVIPLLIIGLAYRIWRRRRAKNLP